MDFPRLNAIVDAAVAAQYRWSVEDLAGAFLESGVRFLQLRAKLLPASALLDHARVLVAAARPYGALVVINDRADIARLSGAAGVHLGQTDLPPALARPLLLAGSLIGRSTHTVAELAAAAQERVDYIAVGPVFGTATKDTGHHAVGLALVERAAATGIPVVAIGGITLDNAESVIAAGARSVAVISDLFTGGDPAARALAYVDRLSRL